MADQNPIHSSAKNPTKPVSSFLNSPKFFNGFLSRTISDPETASILDTRISPNFVTPFGYDNILSKSPTLRPEITNKSPFNKQNPEAIGLALVHSINEERTDIKFSRTVFYGAKLKIQIPTINSQPESPNSPADFGIKTRDSQLWDSQLLSPFSGIPVKDCFTRQISLKEMELSEDYTCVITHGPNPKTTHIFDDCIVENCCEDDPNLGRAFEKVETGFETNVSNSPPLNFLSSCHTCKQSLEQGKDIYIYRGDKAFCNHECRYQEMLFEGMKNEEMDDAF